jgi:hypothetical protein
MKRWILIGFLILLLLIGFSTCSINSCIKDENKQELTKEITNLKNDLATLKATKEITFGNGLRIFDIEKGFYEVKGKIENISSKPMQKVVILVAFYNKDGQLDEDWRSVGTHELNNLFPKEVMDWKVEFGNWTDQELGLFDIYAIGNRS